MLRALYSFLMGSPPISPQARAEALDYIDVSSGILGLQTHEADVYNSTLLVHMNSLDDPQSAQAMVDASQRLVLSAKEAEIGQLYRHIGQLKVERDFLAERSGL